jgi:hypothetical protein
MTSDPDRDGLTNLAEHVLGANPAVSDYASALTFTTVGGHLVLEYRRPLTVDPAIQVIPQIAGNLSAWDESPASVTHTMVSTANGISTWQARDPQPFIPGQHRYLRLKFTSP